MKKGMQLLGLAALLFAFAHIFWNWSDIPNRVPQHYNFAGEVDAWTSKWFILFPPTIGLVIWLGVQLAFRFPDAINMMDVPQERNEKQRNIATVMMRCIQLEVALLFSYLSVKDVYVAKGEAFGFNTWETPLFFFILIGTAVGFSIYSFTQKNNR